MNVARRHLSKGQKAMAAAIAHALKINEFGIKQKAAKIVNVDRSYVSQAATVLEYAPDLASAVLSGLKPLIEA